MARPAGPTRGNDSKTAHCCRCAKVPQLLTMKDELLNDLSLHWWPSALAPSIMDTFQCLHLGSTLTPKP